MSDKLVCPFCQQELERVYSRPFPLICVNCGSLGTDKLWQELIRTRKALDVAVDALKELKPQKAKGGGYWAVKSTDAIKLINTALDQITVLEQKDK